MRRRGGGIQVQLEVAARGPQPGGPMGFDNIYNLTSRPRATIALYIANTHNARAPVPEFRVESNDSTARGFYAHWHIEDHWQGMRRDKTLPASRAPV